MHNASWISQLISICFGPPHCKSSWLSTSYGPSLVSSFQQVATYKTHKEQLIVFFLPIAAGIFSIYDHICFRHEILICSNITFFKRTVRTCASIVQRNKVVILLWFENIAFLCIFLRSSLVRCYIVLLLCVFHLL